MDIELFLCRTDNYGVLIRDPATGTVASIDACDLDGIEAALARRGWRLDTILVTHRHFDHIEAVAPLVERYGAQVIAPILAKSELPQADRFVSEGESIEVGNLVAEVWDTPGHCADHVSYYFASEGVIFVGDVLFVMGCGRVLDSSAEALHRSIRRIMALPDETKVYSGHEYTIANGRFGVHVEPDNAALVARLKTVEALRAQGEFTVPTTIGEERATNVFARAKDAAEFAARRAAKDHF